MRRDRGERAPRALLVVAAVIGFARGPWRDDWELRALAVVTVAGWCGWRTLRRLDLDEGPSLPLAARLGACLAGLVTLAAAFAVADLVTGRLAWPSIHAAYRPALLADGLHVALLAGAAALLLPGPVLSREARDPAAASLGWAAGTAVGLFGALTPLRDMCDAWWPPGDPWRLLMSLAFGAGWLAAASRWRLGPAAARSAGRPDEPVVLGGAVALLAVALLLAFQRDRSGAGALAVLVGGVHLVVVWRALLPRGLAAELTATALLAAGFGLAVAWSVPRPFLRWARRALPALEHLLVPDRVALGASVAFAALVLLVLLRRRATARP